MQLRIDARTKQRQSVATGIAITAIVFSSATYAWSYKEAAEPYSGTTITVLDEVTPLQEAMGKIVDDFVQETGIQVNYELLNHFEVISKGQADMLSGRGQYDAVMLHSPQMGLLLSADKILPINDLMNDSNLNNPDLGLDQLIQPSWDSVAKFNDQTYGFLNWAYNQVYWARADLLNHPAEQEAFKAKYGYDLAPATTMEQVRDIAEFFTRPKGEQLAGETLEGDFYGIVLEGIKGGTTFWSVWNNFIKNWGGDIFDESGVPTVDRAENIEAVAFWASLWKFSPPGQAEYSLIDVPTVMGNGIAAQSIAWSDFVFGIDTPSASKLHGSFTYAGVPPREGQTTPRYVEGEPSLIVISSHSKHPEATYLFMQWMVDEATQAKLFEALGGGVPMRNQTWDLPVVQNAAIPDLYPAMRESLTYVSAKPKAPKLYEVADVLGGIFQEIGLGQMSAEDGLKSGQAQVLKICEQCFLQ